MANAFPNLFSPFQLKSTEIRNRIFSTGHDTYLPEHGRPSDALIAYQREQDRRRALEQSVAANELAVKLAEERYLRGLTTFLNVLETQRALYLSQSSLVASNARISTSLVALYKALGGGWPCC